MDAASVWLKIDDEEAGDQGPRAVEAVPDLHHRVVRGHPEAAHIAQVIRSPETVPRANQLLVRDPNPRKLPSQGLVQDHMVSGPNQDLYQKKMVPRDPVPGP